MKCRLEDIGHSSENRGGGEGKHGLEDAKIRAIAGPQDKVRACVIERRTR